MSLQPAVNTARNDHWWIPPNSRATAPGLVGGGAGPLGALSTVLQNRQAMVSRAFVLEFMFKE